MKKEEEAIRARQYTIIDILVWYAPLFPTLPRSS